MKLLSDHQFRLKGFAVDSKPLGRGAYGIVFGATKHGTKEKVAIKKAFIHEEDEGVPASALREISALKQLLHPNIVKFKGVNYKEHDLYIAFERHPFDLGYLIKNTSPATGFGQKTIKIFMADILSGLNYIHSLGFLHRDIKPANILVSNNGRLKIADFGLMRERVIPNRKLTMEVVTLGYRAPEVLLETNFYDSSIDIWSVGCIFAELYNLKQLFKACNIIDHTLQLFEKMGTPNEHTWPGVNKFENFGNFSGFSNKPQGFRKLCPTMDIKARELIEKLLVCYPKERLSAKEALASEYFQIEDPKLYNKYWDITAQVKPIVP